VRWPPDRWKSNVVTPAHSGWRLFICQFVGWYRHLSGFNFSAYSVYSPNRRHKTIAIVKANPARTIHFRTSDCTSGCEILCDIILSMDGLAGEDRCRGRWSTRAAAIDCVSGVVLSAPGRDAIASTNDFIAASFVSLESRAPSSHGSRSSRANSERTVSSAPFFYSPTTA